MLEDFELCDLGFLGAPFTWCNNIDGEHCILERLDHVLANSLWCLSFPNLSVRHGHAPYSDYSPIWLETVGSLPIRRGSRPFKFEAMWVGESECEKIIEHVWQSCPPIKSVEEIPNLVSNCGSWLKTWNKTSFGNVQ